MRRGPDKIATPTSELSPIIQDTMGVDAKQYPLDDRAKRFNEEASRILAARLQIFCIYSHTYI
jgi:hypothetical protein